MGTLSEPPGHLSLSDSAAKSMVSAMIAVLLCSRTVPPASARAFVRATACGVRRSLTSEAGTIWAASAGSPTAAHLEGGGGRDWEQATPFKNGAPDALLWLTRSRWGLARSATSIAAGDAAPQDPNFLFLALPPPPPPPKSDRTLTASGARGWTDLVSCGLRGSPPHPYGSSGAGSHLARTISASGSSGRMASSNALATTPSSALQRLFVFSLALTAQLSGSRAALLATLVSLPSASAVCATCKDFIQGCPGGDECPWVKGIAANTAAMAARSSA